MQKDSQDKRIILLSVLILLCGFLAGVDALTYANPFVKVANMFYNKNMYSRSIEIYRKARATVNDKETLNFNIANAYYRTGDFKNAMKYFEMSLKSDDSEFNAKVMFNMGNTFFKRGEFVKAYKRYKSSLKLNPDEKSAKYNLEFVLSMIDDSKKQKVKKYSDEEKNVRNRSGDFQSDNGIDNSRGDGNNEPQPDGVNSQITFSSDYKARNDLDDISKEDARRILNTLTEQVMVRKPMRKEPLTKMGEFDEKDW